MHLSLKRRNFENEGELVQAGGMRQLRKPYRLGFKNLGNCVLVFRLCWHAA
jgi:hypothetical protein